MTKTRSVFPESKLLTVLVVAACSVGFAAPQVKSAPKKVLTLNGSAAGSTGSDSSTGRSAAASKGGSKGVVDGVQPAALDQPRVQIELRRTASGVPLAPDPKAKSKDQDTSALLKGLGMGDLADGPGITAFLDTGASGVLLSSGAVQSLGIRPLTGATFEDVGVGGSEEFSVSEPLFVSVAPGAGKPIPFAPLPVRAQLSRGAGMMESLVGDLNVAGMPLLNGRIVQLDTGPVDSLAGTLGVQFVPAAPATQYTIKLTPFSFKRFTRTVPASAAPTLIDNPMIAGITVTYHGKSATGTFLLDTGAAASMISTQLAATLGVPAQPPKPDFSLTVGGIGGQQKSPGLFFDALTLPAGPTYRHAPLLVKDITLLDPVTKEQKTLDGVFGMNYLAGSANVSEGAAPDIGKITPSAYKTIVIDLKNNVLGLTLK